MTMAETTTSKAVLAGEVPGAQGTQGQGFVKVGVTGCN
jgi:hypothetical protein